MESPLNWIVATAICIAAATAEGVLAGPGATKTVASLKQPAWSLPVPAWLAIGLVYYALALHTLGLLFGLSAPSGRIATALLLIIMAANAAWNWLFFGRRDFELSHRLAYPYALAAIALAILLVRVDRMTAALWGVYCAYCVYALAWTDAIRRLNRP